MIHITVTRPGVGVREALVTDRFDLLDFAEASVRILEPGMCHAAASAIDEQLTAVEAQRTYDACPSASLMTADPEFVISWRDYTSGDADLPVTG